MRLSSRASLLLASVAVLGALSTGCDSGGATDPARFPVVVDFSDMNPHLGQSIHLRVIHVETGTEVGRTSLATITSPVFALTVPDVLVVGERYWVDFYADHDGDGRYDAPPVDHAWRRVIAAAQVGGAHLDFPHDAVFTDIRWPD